MSDTRAQTPGSASPRPPEAWEGTIASNQAWRSDRALPRYVRLCGSASLALFDPRSGSFGVAPCLCWSWRCPHCAPARNREDASRVRQAMKEHGPEGFLFIVLTFARHDSAARETRPAVRGFRHKREAFEQMGACFDHARRALAKRRAYLTTCPREALRGGQRYSKKRLRYVATVEQHKDGFPHMNVLLFAPDQAARIRAGEGDQVHAELLDVFVRAGFGYQLFVDAVDPSRGDLAEYVIKHAPHAHNMDREMLKATQLPVEGGWHFRRMRSSKFFLPPVPESEWLGVRIPAELDRVAAELERFGPEAFFTHEQLYGLPEAPRAIGSILASQWPGIVCETDSARSGAERRTAFAGEVRRLGTVAPYERQLAFVAPSARAARSERPEAEWNGALRDEDLARFLESWSANTRTRHEASAARTARDCARSWGARAAGVGGAERPSDSERNKPERLVPVHLVGAARSGAPPALAPRG